MILQKNGEPYIAESRMQMLIKKAIRHFDENEVTEYKEALERFLDSLEGVRATDRDLALVSLFVVWDKMEEKIFIESG